MSTAFAVTVDYPQPPAAVYAYLADPRNRPGWQSSLRAIDALSGEGDVGSSWYDVTVPGLRAHMSVTLAEPPTTWAEHGTWRSVVADLRLDLSPYHGGTRLVAGVRFETPGLPRLVGRVVGWGLRLLGPAGVRHDLKRARTLVPH